MWSGAAPTWWSDDPDRCHSRLGWCWFGEIRWLVTRRDWSTPHRRTLSSKIGWQARYLQGWQSGDFISVLPDSSPRVSFHPNKLAVITSTGGRSQHNFIPYLSQWLFFAFLPLSLQRAFADTSPTKIVMNLASPSGPPSRLKTNCDFSPNAEWLSPGRRMGAARPFRTSIRVWISSKCGVFLSIRDSCSSFSYPDVEACWSDCHGGSLAIP